MNEEESGLLHFRSEEEMAMRALIVPRLRRLAPGARIIHELPLRYSSNRIDLAAVTPDEIVCVEIKSSKDVADRLEAQLRAFQPVSSRIICALAPKWNEKLPSLVEQKRGHTRYTPQLTAARAAIERVGWRGVEVWTVDAENSSIEETGGGWRNARTHTAAMLDMLHNQELSVIASKHQIGVGRRPNHETYVEQCWRYMTGREVIRAVCGALRTRDAFGAASDPPIAEKELQRSA